MHIFYLQLITYIVLIDIVRYLLGCISGEAIVFCVDSEYTTLNILIN